MTFSSGYVLHSRGVFTLLMFFPSQEYGVPFMETSAKTGVNVDLAFQAIGK